ncbi:MAG: TIGR01459 family HAD-type hydrolase [Hyphomicrobiaceae bacterium]
MPKSPTNSVPLIASVADIGRTYKAWISDIWGVLHNGREAFPAASATCVAFRRQGGTIVLVTNAARPREDVVAMLRRLHVPDDAYDDVVTSGDVTRELIRPWRGRAVHHLGPNRQLSIFDGLGVSLTTADTCDVVVCTALIEDDHETPHDYRERLAAFRARDLTMICANPDLIVERGDRIIYCAGALAEAYAKLGGTVQYAGKPHAPIYERAFTLIAAANGGPVAKTDILAIGDGLRTDIAGAQAMGLKSLFIGSALHVPHGHKLDDALLGTLFDGHAWPPIAAQRALVW